MLPKTDSKKCVCHSFVRLKPISSTCNLPTTSLDTDLRGLLRTLFLSCPVCFTTSETQGAQFLAPLLSDRDGPPAPSPASLHACLQAGSNSVPRSQLFEEIAILVPQIRTQMMDKTVEDAQPQIVKCTVPVPKRSCAGRIQPSCTRTTMKRKPCRLTPSPWRRR